MLWPRSLFMGLLLAVVVLVPPARAAWEDALAAYEDGRFEEALAQLLPLAEADNVEAQEIVADIYIYGQGVDIDPQEALKWSRRAAALGSAEAENDIAVHYSRGEGVEQDDAEALKWFERAAEHGNAKALISLSRRYLYGTDGLEPDFGLGLAYLFAAADGGHPRALWSLAQFTATGRFGLYPDQREAVRLYERAAELRYPRRPGRTCLRLCDGAWRGPGSPQGHHVAGHRGQGALHPRRPDLRTLGRARPDAERGRSGGPDGRGLGEQPPADVAPQCQ